MTENAEKLKTAVTNRPHVEITGGLLAVSLLVYAVILPLLYVFSLYHGTVDLLFDIWWIPICASALVVGGIAIVGEPFYQLHRAFRQKAGESE
jgi:hypothetical protein